MPNYGFWIPCGVAKLVGQVEQITLSGHDAMRRGQEVIDATERAMFPLDARGATLIGVAPGIDLARAVLDQMGIALYIPHSLALMPACQFGP